jgi:hypothetical protein
MQMQSRASRARWKISPASPTRVDRARGRRCTRRPKQRRQRERKQNKNQRTDQPTSPNKSQWTIDQGKRRGGRGRLDTAPAGTGGARRATPGSGGQHDREPSLPDRRSTRRECDGRQLPALPAAAARKGRDGSRVLACVRRRETTTAFLSARPQPPTGWLSASRRVGLAPFGFGGGRRKRPGSSTRRWMDHGCVRARLSASPFDFRVGQH